MSQNKRNPLVAVHFRTIAADLEELGELVSEMVRSSDKINPWWILKSQEVLSRLSAQLNHGDVAMLDAPSHVRDHSEGVWDMVNALEDWISSTPDFTNQHQINWFENIWFEISG